MTISKKVRLTEAERDFFTLVMKTIQANQFSTERTDTDIKIAGLFPGTSREIALKKTIDEVRRQIAHLKKDKRDTLTCYREPDRAIIRAAFLFDFFHFYCDDFDQLIINQIHAHEAKTPEPVILDFSDKALSKLHKWGFKHEEALHYFSLCFQLRRAYYFIDQGLVGRSRCMTGFREILWNNVFTNDLKFYNEHLWNKMEDFSTLIIGETGAGKGTAANAIGRSGYIPFNEKKKCFAESFTRSFVSMNISQFPENLIESELFGHKKGSFTGAVDDHKGVFSRCSPYGAIFLDEIGEVSVPIQIKLLKVLEEREFTPVGSRKTHRFKGRIITATNRSFAELNNPNILRKDFYYRLCSDIIVVPPLRQRIKEDPIELDDLIKNRVNKMIGSAPRATLIMLRKKLIKNLGRHYEWPGNVRELEQYIRRILLNRRNPVIHEKEMTEMTSGNTETTVLTKPISQGKINAQDLVKAYCHELYKKSGNLGEVARRTQLDRRTVKKYCDEWLKKAGNRSG